MRSKNSNGFTIIELVVAMAFLGIVVVAVSELYTTLRQANRAANNYTVAVQAAQQLVEKYRNTGYNDIPVGTTDVTSTTLAAHPNLLEPRSATTSVTEENVGMKKIDVTISYKERTGIKTVQFSTLVSYKGLNR